jgi:hypothetical protein
VGTVEGHPAVVVFGPLDRSGVGAVLMVIAGMAAESARELLAGEEDGQHAPALPAPAAAEPVEQQ